MAKYVAILGSLDTKGRDVDYLRQRVILEGGEPLVIDTGVLGEATASFDIDRHQVAQSGNSSIQALIDAKDKANALVIMANGASWILQGYLSRGELGGVLSIGGSRGTALGTQVMQSLPVGLPKLMVSTIANGQNMFGPYIGTKDVMMMHSVADIQGVNAVTRSIYINAAAAIVGMSRSWIPVQKSTKKVLSASMLGVTTALVGQIQELLEPQNAEVIAFHSVGTGGRAMEELIRSGLVAGVFDLTPGEMTQFITGSPSSPGPDRMKAASELGIPQVVSTGGLDFIIEGPMDQLPPKYQGRKIMVHTPNITLVRTSVDEMIAVARLMADRLSHSKGPVAVILPLQAFGWFAMQGQPIHDPESDHAFIQAFKDSVSSNVEVIEMDTHINDKVVGEKAVELMLEMLG